MTPAIQKFLQELYDIDASLREHEGELIPLIEQLLASDPATSPDENFVANLRVRLRERAHTLSTSPSSFSLMNKLLYVISGATVTAVIAGAIFLLPNGDVPTSPLFAFRIEEAGAENAFGSLENMSVANAAEGGRGGAGGGGTGGGMGGDAAVSNLAPTDAATTDEDIDTKIMIDPYFPITQYEYTYEGPLPELRDTVSVYKRDPSGAIIPLSAFADRLNLGVADLNSFNNMNVEAVTFSQNTSFGYQMYVNLRDGSLSINAQWDKWPMSQCQTEACYRAEQVKIGEVPADDQLISIARDFLNDHGVDISQYGAPEVDKMWVRDYERATDKSMAYVPETQRVIFPLLIDGEATYDQSGMKSGISVGVHVKHKRVMDVWGIMDRTYIKSEYEGVTDEAAIKNYMGKINNYPIDATMLRDSEVQVQKATVTLGEPTLAYAVFYRYDNAVTEELLVPSLIFPVTGVQGGDNYYYALNVVVPLEKEMFDEQMNTPPMIPMSEPAMDF